MQGGWGLICGQGTRSHMLQLRACILQLRPFTAKKINNFLKLYTKEASINDVTLQMEKGDSLCEWGVSFFFTTENCSKTFLFSLSFFTIENFL